MAKNTKRDLEKITDSLQRLIEKSSLSEKDRSDLILLHQQLKSLTEQQILSKFKRQKKILELTRTIYNIFIRTIAIGGLFDNITSTKDEGDPDGL